MTPVRESNNENNSAAANQMSEQGNSKKGRRQSKNQSLTYRSMRKSSKTTPIGKLNTSRMPGVTIGTNMKDRMRLVTFAEMRKIQKMMEQSHMGPGATDYQKPFGSDVPQRCPFGQKFADKLPDNPGPGTYDFGVADKHTKSSALPQTFSKKINYNS